MGAAQGLPHTFCRVVAPGEPIQAALDHCPAGAAILLGAGNHTLECPLKIEREVHVFGRGEATLVMPRDAYAVICTAPHATLDGLAIRAASVGIQVCICENGRGSRPRPR